MKTVPTLAAALICSVFVASASAQEQAQPTWPRGTRTFDLSTRFATSLAPADKYIPSFAVGVHQFVFNNFSLGAELSGYGIFQPEDDAAAGVGIAAILRHHVIDFGGTTIFIDASFGPMQATNRVPTGGTNFNFTTRTGIGVAHRLSDNSHLIGGARYFHLSNAQYDGRDRNPSINGIEFYAALGWEW